MSRTLGGQRTRRPLRCAPALMLLALACHAVPTAHRAEVGQEVLDAISARGEAQVMVALVNPPSQGDPQADLALRRAEIARLQKAVLDRLDSSDYRSRQLFEFVPAMSGTVLSRKAISVLLAHPNVRRVDLDPAGGGSGIP